MNDEICLLLTFYQRGLLHKIVLKTKLDKLPPDTIQHYMEPDIKNSIRALCNQEDIKGMVLVNIEEIMDIYVNLD